MLPWSVCCVSSTRLGIISWVLTTIIPDLVLFKHPLKFLILIRWTLTFLLFHLSHNFIAQYKYTLTLTHNSSSQLLITGFKDTGYFSFLTKNYLSQTNSSYSLFHFYYFYQNLLFNIFSKITLGIFSTETFHIFNFSCQI